MGKRNIVKEKSFSFAVEIINLYKLLISEQKEFILSKQLLRSGTAVGANIREAEHAESKADFIHKMAIAQKEINESIYWLELLSQTKYINQKQFDRLNNNAIEIIKIITKIIKSTKDNI